MEKDWHRESDDQDIGRNVHDGVGDHVVRLSRAIHYTSILIAAWSKHQSQLTVVWRNLPVVVEGPTPRREEQNLHEDEAKDNISCDNLDQPVLPQTRTIIVDVSTRTTQLVEMRELTSIDCT